MQDGVKLERKTKDELKQIAQGLGIEKISALKKDEIIALIREKREQIANEEKQKVQPKKRERPADAVEVKGVLDVMTDGFGFLRMENYMSGKNDIYVSPTQIRRFNLKTGDITRKARFANYASRCIENAILTRANAGWRIGTISTALGVILVLFRVYREGGPVDFILR